MAVYFNHKGVIDLLMKSGADVNARTNVSTILSVVSDLAFPLQTYLP